MKTILLTCLLSFSVLTSIGQNTSGITGIPDTSFTIASEYKKHIKRYPAINAAVLKHSKKVKSKLDLEYCKVDNKELKLDVFYPKKKRERNGAAIMILFGGGWRSGNRQQHHPLAERLAEQGYVCFTPDYRLSTDALFPAAVYDLKAALRWISRHANKYGIKDNKIAVMGFSAGGELAAFLGTTSGNPEWKGSNCNLNNHASVSAVIDLDGTLSFVHPESGEGDDSKKLSAATLWFGYSKKDNPRLWDEASPLTHISDAAPPTLFINSSVDRMHAGRDDYMKYLRQHNIYTDVKTFENSPHSFPLFHPWFEPTVNYVNEFLLHVFFNK